MTLIDPLSPLMEFDEVEPAEDCICGGCSARRRARLHAAPVHEGGHAAARSMRRRAAVLMAAVGTAIGGGTAAAGTAVATPAPSPTPGGSTNPQTPQTPQGEVSGLYGQAPGARAFAAPRAAAAPVTRAQIIQRAQGWIDQGVPYSMSRYWSDGYRQDCSGFVSMAWGLGSSQTTWTLPNFAERIGKNDLQPGDVLIYNNAANPQAGSHVTIFGGWADSSRTRYVAYEQTSPGALKRSTPYAYWNNSGAYVPYRYTGLSGGSNDGGASSNAFPGADKFGPGANNAYVTKLGQMLVQRGGAKFYSEGPGPRWGEADRKAVQAFQQAQGWTGAEADGIPGKATWDYLVNGKGRNIDGGTPPPPPPTDTTAFPGADKFGPGANNAYVTKLGQMLVQRGGARFYSEGPGPRWGEADRKAVQAFQQAQGWTGAEADGIPGKATWDYLVNGKGRNIDGGTPLPPPPPPAGSAAYPGSQYFGPGQNNDYVRQLGEQLVRKGFGGYYGVGPGPRWSESDRRAVQAFQQAQGWRGAEADGYPGPDTWRRLFS